MGLKENVSLSLDAEVVSEVRAEAGTGSLSEWMNDAALCACKRFASIGSSRRRAS